MFTVVGVNHWNYLQTEMVYSLPLGIFRSVLDVFLKAMIQSNPFLLM